MRHKVRGKKDNDKAYIKKRRGFTLVELLAIVVIIASVCGIGFSVYSSVVESAKSNATALAIESVKSSAELYSKEENKDIKWLSFYDNSTGEKNGRYVCMTVQQLINAGFFKENFFDDDIYKKSEIGTNTFFEIKQNASGAQTEIIMHQEADNKLMCEISAINAELDDLEITKEVIYTDRFSFDFGFKGDNTDFGEVEYSCYMGSTPGMINSNTCSFEKLEDDAWYGEIKFCISPKAGNTNLTSTLCEMASIRTKAFKKPIIEVSDADEWTTSKKVTISYDDEGIYQEVGYHYFKSDINAIVKSASTTSKVYLCSDDVSFCDTTTAIKNIVAGKWYMISGDSVSIEVVENIGDAKMEIIARIQDSTGNYFDKSEFVTKIDTLAPTCVSSGGSSTWINKSSSQTKVTIVGTCNDGSGSGCKNSTTSATFTTDQNNNKSPGTVTDNVGNSTSCETSAVKIDKSPPTCTVTNSSGGNWTNGTVIITGTCGDGSGSGCKSSSVSATFTTAQNSTKSPGTVTDNVGNSTSCETSAVKIETTKPTVSVTMYKRKKKDDGTYTKTGSALCSATATSTDSAVSLSSCTGKTNGWYNKEDFPYGVYFVISASDAGGSGLSKKIWYYNDSGYPKETDNSKYTGFKRTANNEEKVSSDNSAYLSGDGYRYARYLVRDAAGNSSYVNITVPIDKTGPSIVCDSTGWNDKCCEERDGLSYVLRCYYYDNVSGLESRKYGYCTRSCNPNSEYNNASYSTETQSRKQFEDVMWYRYSEMRWVYDEWFRTNNRSNYKISIKDQAGNTSSAVTWNGSYTSGTNNAKSDFGEKKGRCETWETSSGSTKKCSLVK